MTMRALVLAPLHNKEGRKDATGAFQPEATKFCQLHNVADRVHLIDNHDDPMEMRLAVYQLLDSAPRGSLDCVAVFCHGWKNGLQFGIGREHLTGLAIRIRQACKANARVVLYACSTARDMDADEEDDKNDHVGGDGGFADLLRDLLADNGAAITVFAHSTAGHATENPFLRVFLPTERMGGRFVVARNSGLWKKWAQCMKTTSLRFQVPFLSQIELEEWLTNT